MKRYIKNPEKILSKYSPEQIEFVQEYIDEISDIEVLELQGDDFVDIDPQDEIDSIYALYGRVALDDGIFDNINDFHEVLDALYAKEAAR